MSSTVPILIFLFSFINIMYMNFMQNGMYADFIGDSNVMVILLAYAAWALMAYALKKFVIEAKGFGFKSAFIHAPVIGALIYTCISVVIMNLEPAWSIQLAITDIVFGASMFSFITLITVIFRSYFD
jgi:hypothetical protein